MNSNVLQYYTPYESRKYGYVRGDKKDVFFKVDFNEGKFYKTEEGYVLMCDVLGFMGVVKAFKPEEGIVMPGWTQISYYSKDYELWDKKEKKSVTVAPTIHEKNLCNHLIMTISEDKYYRGSITLLPDSKFSGLSDKEALDLVVTNCQLIEVEPSGNLIPYEPTVGSNYKNKSSNYGGNNKLSPEDKIKALKKELVASIKEDGHNTEMSLIDLIDVIVTETENENTLAVYVDLVKSILN